MVSALRIRGAEVPCVKEGKAEYLDANGLCELRARVQRHSGCVQSVEQGISSCYERSGLRNLDNHTITVDGSTNLTDFEMKSLFYFPYSTPNSSLLFHHANIRHGTLHHQTEQIQHQARALA